MVATLAWEYRGFTFGEGSDFHVTNISGFDPPENREDIIQRSVEHGAFTYVEFSDYRRMTLEGFMGDDNLDLFQQKIDLAMAATMASREDLPLLFRLPGREAQRSFCKPARRSYSIDVEYSLGFTKWAVQWLAGDPRLYSNELLTATFSGDQQITNMGNFNTLPVVKFNSATNPSVESLTTEDGIFLSGSGEWRIDFPAKTITLNGNSNYAALDQEASEWWALQSGTNNIRVTGGTAVIEWRHAWL